MHERITCISYFKSAELEQINNLLKHIEEPLCKVPFGKNVEDRKKADTLPYHFTLSAWDIERKEEVLQALSKIAFHPFKIQIDKIEIRKGKENSFVLYFHIQKNQELVSLHQKIYSLFPNEKYNPSHFTFHITITIDKDSEKIIRIKDELAKHFTPFELEVDELGLFEIYPAHLIKRIK